MNPFVVHSCLPPAATNSPNRCERASERGGTNQTRVDKKRHRKWQTGAAMIGGDSERIFYLGPNLFQFPRHRQKWLRISSIPVYMVVGENSKKAGFFADRYVGPGKIPFFPPLLSDALEGRTPCRSPSSGGLLGGSVVRLFGCLFSRSLSLTLSLGVVRSRDLAKLL